MNCEQAFDPVDVLDSFADQPATLTMQPTVVLFGDTRHAHNAPNFWLTSQIRHQRSQQSLDVNSVRLGSASPTNQPAHSPDPTSAFLQFTSNTRPNPLAQLQKWQRA